MSDIFWATWNDCNGVFDVYRTRKMARDAAGGPDSEFVSVVPVYVNLVPESELRHCHWDEDEREKWRTPENAE